MNKAAHQKQIRELSAEYMPGIAGAFAQIQKNLDRPTIVPFKMAADYFLTEVVRDGKAVKVQVEIDSFTEPQESEDEEGRFEWTEHQVEVGRAYTTDSELRDIELTKEEQEAVELAYLQKKLGKDHPYFGS